MAGAQLAGAWHAEPSAWLAGALRAGRIAAPTESAPGGNAVLDELAPDEIEAPGASVPGGIAVLDASVRDGNAVLGALVRDGNEALGASVPGANAVPGEREPDELGRGPLGGSLVDLSNCAVARTVAG